MQYLVTKGVHSHIVQFVEFRTIAGIPVVVIFVLQVGIPSQWYNVSCAMRQPLGDFPTNLGIVLFNISIHIILPYSDVAMPFSSPTG